MPRSSGPLPRRTLLLVEDDEDLGGLFVAHLFEIGYVVSWVRNGNEAIARALRERPDAIVIDLGLPGLDGAEAIAVLRSYPTTMSTPIVVCSARAGLPKALGCDAYVRKPCTARDLEVALLEAVAKHSDSKAG